MIAVRVELDQLRLRNRELESQAAEAQRLKALLNFRNAHPEATDARRAGDRLQRRSHFAHSCSSIAGSTIICA